VSKVQLSPTLLIAVGVVVPTASESALRRLSGRSLLEDDAPAALLPPIPRAGAPPPAARHLQTLPIRSTAAAVVTITPASIAGFGAAITSAGWWPPLGGCFVFAKLTGGGGGGAQGAKLGRDGRDRL